MILNKRVQFPVCLFWSEMDLCFLSSRILYIDAVRYMNISLLSPVSLPEKGFPRKRRKIDANLDDKAFEFYFFFCYFISSSVSLLFTLDACF